MCPFYIYIFCLLYLIYQSFLCFDHWQNVSRTLWDPSVQKDEAVGVDLLDLNDLNFPGLSWNFSAPRRPNGMELPLGRENDPTTVGNLMLFKFMVV